MTNVTKFEIVTEQLLIDDLKRRLQEIKWPQQNATNSWDYGTDISYLQELSVYWNEHFDWYSFEKQFNQYDHFIMNIDGLKTHFIHQKSPHSEAVPLIITHGWPGSIIEFLPIIRKLTHPEEWGGNPEDAFHVVCPSLPGFAWSELPVDGGLNAEAIARRHCKLMSELGYNQYLAQGGDWGAVVTRQLATIDADHCVGIHLNMVPMNPSEAMMAKYSELSTVDQHRLARTNQFKNEGMAYYYLQSTQPQTLAYGLSDSPIGLAAWMVEKFRSWSDCHGEIESVIDRDWLLANITLYWLTNSISTSMRIYYEEMRKPSINHYVNVATGVSVFPEEIFYSPKLWAEEEYNIVYWNEMPKGGHFAALEQPDFFIKELVNYKRELKK